ncbi:hypothetical protein GF323_02390 [Candidatus Woesearchaeota archaeon]|nr:hypothetical protein [Candidatus Woesearchaeota archaeon]
MEQKTRMTAVKVPINALVKGEYIRDEEEFSPNYIEINNRKVSRINVIGIIVSVGVENGSSFLIDDGSAKIIVRGFENSPIPGDVKIGDIVNIIGRPREFNSERYIVPEIIKKTDQKWMQVRKLELRNFSLAEKEDIPVENIESPEGVIADQEKIIQYISKTDEGKGVEIEKVIQETAIRGCEEKIEGMLKEGDLFENLPGRVKVLD